MLYNVPSVLYLVYSTVNCHVKDKVLPVLIFKVEKVNYDTFEPVH